MATKVIHLELFSNLTSEALIATLKRFITRRGFIDHLYSDNGSDFVGANREFKTFLSLKQQRKISMAIHSSEFTRFWRTVGSRC